MNAPPDNPRFRKEGIEATAAAWLAEKDAGLSPEAQADFDLWMATDPAHREAVDRLAKAFANLCVLRDFRPRTARHPDPNILAPAAMRPRHRRFAAVIAFSSGIAALGLFLFTRVELIEPAQVSAYATLDEGYKRIVLEDESIVELNVSTALSVHYTSDERLVRISRGEAHFVVAKDPARPFRVQAGDFVAEAIGTVFNVRFDQDGVRLLVTEGTVVFTEASHIRVPAASARISASPGQSLVTAGESVSVSPREPHANPQYRRPDPLELSQALAWQGSQLYFNDTPLSEVARRFNQHNRVKLAIGSPQLAALTIGGTFRSENVEAFVRLLANDERIAITHANESEILLTLKE